MAAVYDATSPYYLTQYSQYFLDVMVNRPIPQETDDLMFIWHRRIVVGVLSTQSKHTNKTTTRLFSWHKNLPA